jgi:hypothetical protein
MDMTTTPNSKQSPLRTPWATAGFCTLLAIAAFYLWTEHRAHVMGALPYLLLLSCPIIHLLMHRGHHSHSHGEHHDHGSAS